MQKQIESLIGKINDDTTMIKRLLSEKKKVLGSLYTALESKRQLKVALKENEIDAFSKFMSYYETEKKSMDEQFRFMYFGKGGDFEKRNAHTYELISKDLDSLNEWQTGMLQRLKDVVEEGEGVLKLINN